MPAADPAAATPWAAPVAWTALPGRTALLVTGADAVAFVDHFTTAAIGRLAVGSGTEGFFADARGQVLALANCLRVADGVWIDGPPEIGPRLLAHLEHHHIREAVRFDDRSADRASLLVAGPGAAAWLAARAAVPAAPLDHVAATVGGIPLAIVRCDWFGPDCFLLQAAAAEGPALAGWLGAAGLPAAPPVAAETARIEACSPAPADIGTKSLPQELGRDARAICLTKGCYLGQETVARIDALGHVNRRLVAVAASAPLAPGAAVTQAGEAVGTVTSACWSPRLACHLGLAIVHVRGLGDPVGLAVGGSPARVVPPPAWEAFP
jgi:folate-binding protein YgfZ